MGENSVNTLEWWAGIDAVEGVASETRRHFLTPPGLSLAEQIANHLSAYNATDDLVPYFGDYRLAHTEAFYQLQNSVSLAYHGFYSQALATLRAVCELSLLQASLPEGHILSDRVLDTLRSVMSPGQDLPSQNEVNWILPVGFCTTQTPEREATTLAEWAVEGCRTPKWRSMSKRLFLTDVARKFNSETQFSARLQDSLSDLDPYVHARGHLRSATGLSSGNMLRFSEKSLLQYSTRMMCTTQVSITVLLIAFLPSATSYPDAAAGFINDSDLYRTLSVLPSKDAELLRAIYDNRDACTGSSQQ